MVRVRLVPLHENEAQLQIDQTKLLLKGSTIQENSMVSESTFKSTIVEYFDPVPIKTVIDQFNITRFDVKVVTMHKFEEFAENVSQSLKPYIKFEDAVLAVLASIPPDQKNMHCVIGKEISQQNISYADKWIYIKTEQYDCYVFQFHAIDIFAEDISKYGELRNSLPKSIVFQSKTEIYTTNLSDQIFKKTSIVFKGDRVYEDVYVKGKPGVKTLATEERNLQRKKTQNRLINFQKLFQRLDVKQTFLDYFKTNYSKLYGIVEQDAEKNLQEIEPFMLILYPETYRRLLNDAFHDKLPDRFDKLVCDYIKPIMTLYEVKQFRRESPFQYAKLKKNALLKLFQIDEF